MLSLLAESMDSNEPTVLDDIGIADAEVEQEELNGNIDSESKLESTDTLHPVYQH